MHVLTYAKLVGLLTTSAIGFWLIGKEYRGAEWTQLFREIMGATPKGYRGGRKWLRQYFSRMERNFGLLDKPYEARKLIIKMLLVFLVLFAATLLLHYFFVIGIVISSAITLVVFDRFYASKGKKREEAILTAFLYEGVPVALHVLTATGSLNDAVLRMSEMVRLKALSKRLKRLLELIRTPQFAAAEDALMWWAEDLGIRDIIYFSLATKEASKFDVPLDELWLEMADLFGKDLEYVRGIRARTNHHRKGGYVFYGMLAGSFLIAYPFANKYMIGSTKIVFWLVLAVMTLGLYLIIRDSQRIDV